MTLPENKPDTAVGAVRGSAGWQMLVVLAAMSRVTRREIICDKAGKARPEGSAAMRVKPKYVAPLLATAVTAVSIAVAPLAAAAGSQIQSSSGGTTGDGSSWDDLGGYPLLPDGADPLVPFGTHEQPNISLDQPG